MFLNFLGRDSELKALEDRFQSNKFEFIVIYGRRRVGKTTLIKKFLEGRERLYFLCDRAGTVRNSMRLKKKISEHYSVPAIESNDIYDIFSHLVSNLKEKTVIVLDEFSYLVEKDDSIPSVFQNIVDEILVNTDSTLILCGSSISMMEKGVLSAKSPLYGRKTAHIKLKELFFSDFYDTNNLRKSIELYSITGGIPFYLERLQSDDNTIEIIKKEIFSRFGNLYEEVEFLMKEEFREPDIYKAIISAVASGNSRLSNIADSVKIPVNDMPKYMNSLISLGMIEKEYSVLDTRKKKPLYSIKDNFIKFWFTFCEPFKSDLEIEDFTAPEEYLKNNFNSYVSKRFEELIRYEFARKIIPFRFHSFGKLWYGETEIDICAMDKSEISAALIEVKYEDNISLSEEYEKLKEKVEKLPFNCSDINLFVVAMSFSDNGMGGIEFRKLLLP